MPAEDIAVHREFRAKMIRVYNEIISRAVYVNSRQHIQFGYEDRFRRKVTKYLDPMVSSAIVNGLVPKSGVLYRGGHGGGKTILVQKVCRAITGLSEKEIAESMIRGNDSATINTLLASLHVGRLMSAGAEEVRWRKFVTCFVKIIDEVNRFPPAAVNPLFEILNTGRAAYLDDTYEVDDFISFATENPNDPGTYELPRPFLDRYSFCVPAPQIPTANDLFILSERADDRIYDIEVEPVSSIDGLKTIRRMIADQVQFDPMAKLYVIYLCEALSTCERADQHDKSQNDIEVGQRCKGCAFDSEGAFCKYTMAGISGRAFLDLQRWAKAYSWFLDAFTDETEPKVQMSVVQQIASNVLLHRLEPNRQMLDSEPYFGRRLMYARDLVQKITNSFNTALPALLQLPDVLEGRVKPYDSVIWTNVKKDLVIKYHFRPLIEEVDSSEFKDLYRLLSMRGRTLDELERVKEHLLYHSSLRPHAQKYLISMLCDRTREAESGQPVKTEGGRLVASDKAENGRLVAGNVVAVDTEPVDSPVKPGEAEQRVV